MAYACVCASITDEQVTQFIRQGFDTVEKLSTELGVCQNCGCCYEYINNLIEKFYKSSLD